MKKIYTFALAMLVASTALGAETFTVDGVKYALLEDGSGVEVADCQLEGSVTIPKVVKNGAITYKVVAVGKNAFLYSPTTSVTLPNTVLEIKSGAFNASDVVKVDMGTGIEILRDNVFGFARDIEEISELPASLTLIDGNPFVGNFKLKAIRIAEDNPAYKAVDGVLFNKEGNKLISYPYGRALEYVIPEGVDTIGRDVFNTFQELTKITFPSTLKMVSVGAFTYCTGMVNTNDLPEGLEYVGSNAFSNCRKLNVTLPSTLSTLSGTAFNNNWSMQEIHIPGSVKVVGYQAFNDARSCKSIIIDEGVEELSSFCFQSIPGVKSVKIPNSVTTIGAYAFSGCKGVKRLEVGEKVATIDACGFAYMNPDTIIVRALTPPEYTNDKYYMTGPECLETALVFVPDESIAAYKDAWMWKFFKNYKPLSELTSGINDVVAEKQTVGKVYYNLSGMKVDEPAAADGKLYIVVTTFDDGSSKAQKIINR